MSDKLSNIENKILEELYKREYEKNLDIEININSLSLSEEENKSKTIEAGYWLKELKRMDYIDFIENQAFHCGGAIHEKYNNNIITIYWKNIHLLYKGKNYVEEIRKTVWDKLFNSFNNFFLDISKEIRSRIISHIVTFILGFVLALIYVYLSK
jgi:hypothetical protein